MKIEGKNAVLEALNSDNTIDGIMAEKGATGVIISLAKEKNVKVQFVDKFVLDKLSVTGKHQGYIATTSDFVYCEIEDIIAGERGSRMVVVLDGVEDP
ncbi:MAG: RNA methyltransferase substrate-binding domain-containing protein, partial [Clostridia bacterium]